MNLVRNNDYRVPEKRERRNFAHIYILIDITGGEVEGGRREKEDIQTRNLRNLSESSSLRTLHNSSHARCDICCGQTDVSSDITFPIGTWL